MDGENKIERLSTGIDGLDELLYGGIPEKSQILLLGEAGSGKTLLSFEIAYHNAKRGVPTTYLTIEENRKALISFVVSTFSEFSDAKEFIGTTRLNVVEKKLQYAIRSPESIQEMVAEIIRTTELNSSKLLIIDSFSLLRSLYGDDRSFTRGINYIVESIRDQGVTSIMTFETAEKDPDEPPGLFEESMFDGIIKLQREAISGSEMQYFLNVVKMRYSKFKSTLCKMTITPHGIEIEPKR